MGWCQLIACHIQTGALEICLKTFERHKRKVQYRKQIGRTEELKVECGIVLIRLENVVTLKYIGAIVFATNCCKALRFDLKGRRLS